MRIERFRWWHIAEVMPLEQDLFGEEKWSRAMFWNELAQHNFYIVAADESEVVGYAGLAVTGCGQRARPAPLRPIRFRAGRDPARLLPTQQH
jgi:hypothetical protein